MIDILDSLRESSKNYTRILKKIGKEENITIQDGDFRFQKTFGLEV